MKTPSRRPTVRDFVRYCELNDACEAGLDRIHKFLDERGEGSLNLPARDLIMSVAGDVDENRHMYLEWFINRLLDELISMKYEDRIHVKAGHFYDKYAGPAWEAHKWLWREMRNRANQDPEVYPYVGRQYGEKMCATILPLLRLYVAYTEKEGRGHLHQQHIRA